VVLTSQVRIPPHLFISVTRILTLSDIAQRTAEWLGVEFHPVPITEETIVSKFEDTIWHSEVPLPDTNGIGRLAMAEAAKSQGIKVILTGLSFSIILADFSS
jgi:hypothetical protein